MHSRISFRDGPAGPRQKSAAPEHLGHPFDSSPTSWTLPAQRATEKQFSCTSQLDRPGTAGSLGQSGHYASLSATHAVYNGSEGSRRAHIQSLAKMTREQLAERLFAEKQTTVTLREQVKHSQVDARKLEAALARAQHPPHVHGAAAGVAPRSDLPRNIREKNRALRKELAHVTAELDALKRATRHTRTRELEAEIEALRDEVARSLARRRALQARLDGLERLGAAPPVPIPTRRCQSAGPGEAELGQQRKLSGVLSDLRQAATVLQAEADFLSSNCGGKTAADFKREPRLAAAAQLNPDGPSAQAASPTASNMPRPSILKSTEKTDATPAPAPAPALPGIMQEAARALAAAAARLDSASRGQYVADGAVQSALQQIVALTVRLQKRQATLDGAAQPQAQHAPSLLTQSSNVGSAALRPTPPLSQQRSMQNGAAAAVPELESYPDSVADDDGSSSSSCASEAGEAPLEPQGDTRAALDTPEDTRAAFCKQPRGGHSLTRSAPQRKDSSTSSQLEYLRSNAGGQQVFVPGKRAVAAAQAPVAVDADESADGVMSEPANTDPVEEAWVEEVCSAFMSDTASELVPVVHSMPAAPCGRQGSAQCNAASKDDTPPAAGANVSSGHAAEAGTHAEPDVADAKDTTPDTSMSADADRSAAANNEPQQCSEGSHNNIHSADGFTGAVRATDTADAAQTSCADAPDAAGVSSQPASQPGDEYDSQEPAAAHSDSVASNEPQSALFSDTEADNTKTTPVAAHSDAGADIIALKPATELSGAEGEDDVGQFELAGVDISEASEDGGPTDHGEEITAVFGVADAHPPRSTHSSGADAPRPALDSEVQDSPRNSIAMPGALAPAPSTVSAFAKEALNSTVSAEAERLVPAAADRVRTERPSRAHPIRTRTRTRTGTLESVRSSALPTGTSIEAHAMLDQLSATLEAEFEGEDEAVASSVPNDAQQAPFDSRSSMAPSERAEPGDAAQRQGCKPHGTAMGDSLQQRDSKPHDTVIDSHDAARAHAAFEAKLDSLANDESATADMSVQELQELLVQDSALDDNVLAHVRESVASLATGQSAAAELSAEALRDMLAEELGSLEDLEGGV